MSLAAAWETETVLKPTAAGCKKAWPPEDSRFLRSPKWVGANLYEPLPGESTFPCHYELGNDGLLMMVMWRLTLRAPEAEREFQPGVQPRLAPSGTVRRQITSGHSPECQWTSGTKH